MRFFYKNFPNFICCLLLLCANRLFAQTNLSGIINQYTKVTAIDLVQNSVTVATTTGFKVCDTVLVVQMKGAIINQTNTNVYGSISSLNAAGNHEKAIITNIVGNVVFFRHRLLNSYNPAAFVQLVTIPQYNNVTISGQLTGKAWDGNTGGVIAFEANGTVNITGFVNATGLGFRGGNVNPSAGCATNSTNYAYPPMTNFAAFKGESIAVIDSVTGRGAPANGGGGGACLNGGGGGGSNAAAGGIGGKSPQLLGGTDQVSGIGGRFLSYNSLTSRLFLGGGGGGGHQNDNAGTAGGNGGGIVYIKAQQIIGNGIVNASGQAPATQAGIDGAGGGGAGGTVVLYTAVKPVRVSVFVRGGEGGGNTFAGADCFASGGGGGGGAVISNNIITGLTAALEGGAAGRIDSQTSPCNNTTHGATAGQAGLITINNNMMQIGLLDITTPIVATITTTPVACGVATQGLTVNTTAGATYQWQLNGQDIAGQTTTNHTAMVSGIYRVRVSIGCQVQFSNEVAVTVNSQPIARILNGTEVGVCASAINSVTLVAPLVTGYTYQWKLNNVDIAGATNNTLNITQNGSYTVAVSACTNTNTSLPTIVFTPLSPEVLLLASPNTICANTTTTLVAFPRAAQFDWYFNNVLIAGFTGDTYEATQAGTYRVVSRSLCIQRTSPNLVLTQSASVGAVTITGQNAICRNRLTTLRTNTGAGFQYQWLLNDVAIAGATNSTLQTANAGDYKVRINDACGGSATSPIFTITIIPPPADVFIRGNNVLCNGEARLTTNLRKNPTYSYQWTRNTVNITGATDTTFLATTIGFYTIKVTDTCGVVYESPNFVISPNAVTGITITSPRTVICPSERVTLTATANIITNDLQWQLNGVDIPSAIGGTFIATQAGTYTARTRNICDNRVSTPFVLQVATPPQAQITGNLFFCAGSNTTITANVTNGGANPLYQWFRDGQLFQNAITQSIPIFAAGRYSVRVTNAQGCTAMSPEVTIVASRIDESQVVVTPSRLICGGDNVQLSATGGTRYEWSPAAGLNNAFIDRPVARPTETTMYRVRILNNFGCFVDRFVTIEVVPAFTLDFEVEYSSDCGQKSLVKIINKSEGLNAFNEVTWDMGDGTTLRGLTPVAYIYEKGSTYTITMKVNNRGCNKELTKTVTVESLFTQNVITPNGDGKNDKFVIDNPKENWQLEIFDRYGKKVFESSNYDNEWEGHGTTTLYFYRLVAPSGRECKGWVQVLQNN
jgi:gliding motility-associated-like protein